MAHRNRWFTLKKMVIFHGYVSHNRMVELFSQLAGHVHPSSCPATLAATGAAGRNATEPGDAQRDQRLGRRTLGTVGKNREFHWELIGIREETNRNNGKKTWKHDETCEFHCCLV